MKSKILLSVFILVLFSSFSLLAQNDDDNGYEFTTVKRLDATSVKNQYRSGTCWSFSGLSLLESEMLRKGK
ncbi:MAG: aminopeptidase, partial [Bacteroidota bacterium]